MSLGFVVLCYNDDTLAISYLKRIVNFNIIDKIVVVDNGSKWNYFENLAQGIKTININDKIELIRNDTNDGYAKGNNKGVNYLLSRYKIDTICISNTDVEYDENTISEVLNYVQQKDNVGVAAPHMLDINYKSEIPAWKLPNFGMALWNTSYVRQKIFNPQLYKKPFPNVMSVDALPGSLFFISSEAWIDVGGFDEDTFLYGEESLLAYKLLNKGYINLLISNVYFVHRHSVIINQNIKSIDRKMDLLYQSNYIYNKKCLRLNNFEMKLYRCFFVLGVLELKFCLCVKKIIKRDKGIK